MAIDFLISGPKILARTKRRKTPIPLRVVGHMRDGRRIAIDESKKIPDTSMALFPGHLVPPRVKDISRTEKIVVKFSSDLPDDKFLALERDLLLELSGLEGISRVIGRGKAPVTYWGYGRHDNLKRITREVPFFVMPKIPGKDLYDLTPGEWGKDLSKREKVVFLATKVFPVLAERLAGLHDRKVVHRDVKPGNVMFDRRQNLLNLIDFGKANWLNSTTPRIDLGTFGFFPPELLLTTPKTEDIRVDVYAFGTTFFTVLTGARGILYGGMEDFWQENIWASYLLFGEKRMMESYYRALISFGSLSGDELVEQSNMPSELQRTKLGKYLGRLFHPNRLKRPYNMWKIAENLRKLGGELAEHEIWS